MWFPEAQEYVVIVWVWIPFGCLSVLFQGEVGLGSEVLGLRPRRGAG